MPNQPDPTIGKDGKSYPLTSKQQKFVDVYLQTGFSSEAYRQAYSTEGWTDNAVYVAGSKMLDNPKVAGEISRRRSQEANKVSVTVESIIAELDEIKARAMESEKGVSAAVSAVLGKAKLLGFMVDKVDQTVRQAATEDLKPDLSNLRSRAVQQMSPSVKSDEDNPPHGVVTH